MTRWIARLLSSGRYAALAAAVAGWSCGGSGVGPSSGGPIIVYPRATNVAPGGSMTFLLGGTSGFSSLASLAWSAASGSIESAGFGACVGTYIPPDPNFNLPPSEGFSDCSPKATYTAPASSGSDTVMVRLGGQSATAAVTVSAANWIGQPISIPSNGGAIASNTAVELQDVPYVAQSSGAAILACVTTDGATCTGAEGTGQPGDGPGLMTVAIPAPTVTSSVALTRVIVFMAATGSGCNQPSCAAYSETVNVNFTVTP